MTGTNAAELSESDYAVKRKELLQLLKQLHAVGAQADLDLPQITVIGNQSAGKSSVVEAISGIKVPRDAGTCTRCPMECRLSSSSGPWSCQVSIRWEFKDSQAGERRDEVSEVLFGSRITDKADVEMRLRQAQTAVLNPQVPAKRFLGMTEDEMKKGVTGREPMKFSRNVVCVDLEGPELTDLSFIDLPGLVQNAPDDIVKLVEDLVVSHIKENCLILVALPMTDDIENQKAMQLARKEDTTGHRTIGVVTKPDMLTAGSTKARDLWLDVLEGRRHPLRHGYYCTRQPDDDERENGISSIEARRREADFFKVTQPWAMSKCQERFGTANLVKTLSKLLVTIITDALPKIRTETSQRLSLCTRQLADIPPALTGDPSTQMSILITKFCASIEEHAQGSPQAASLIRENRKAWGDFKLAIRETAPNFKPSVAATVSTGEFENGFGDGEGELISSGKPLYLADMRRHLEQSITRELPDNIPFDAKSLLIKSFQESWHGSTISCFDRVREGVVKILNETISQQFKRYGNLQSQLRIFIMELVEKHRALCHGMLETVLEMEGVPYTQNTHYLETCTQKWLSKYKDARAGKSNTLVEDKPPAAKQKLQQDPPLFANVFSTLGSTASQAALKTSAVNQKTVDTIYATNTGLAPPTPKTTTFSFAQPQSTAAQHLWASPQPPPVTRPSSTSSHPGTFDPTRSRSPPDPEKLRAALASLAEIGYTGIGEEDLGKLHPSDEYETELRVMAEVRGYFQVAYKRVIDNVPSLIDLRFVRAVAKELLPFLIEKFELGTPSASGRCTKYLAEDPEVIAKRDELIAQKKRLESVAAELFNFAP